MNATIRAIWKDNFKRGNGYLETENPLMNQMPYHFMKRTRFEQTLPEEFLGAAYASCFNMTLANLISIAGYDIEALRTECIIHYDAEHVTHADLSLEAKISGISNEAFQEFVDRAKAECPIGRSLSFETNLRINLLPD